MKKTILFTIIAILMISSALAAYDVKITYTSSTPFTAKSYDCINNICSEGTISLMEEKTGTANQMHFTGTGTSTNKDNYTLYLFPTNNCYKPKAYWKAFWGNGELVKTEAVTFVKEPAATCGSNVDNEQLTATEVPVGTEVTISADLQSAWTTSSAIANFIPADLDPYYSSHVDVYFSVNGEEKQHDVLDIPWNEWEHVSYDFTPTSPGTYVLRIATKMDNDCRCEGSNYKYRELTLIVPTEHEIPEFNTLTLAIAIVFGGLALVMLRKR